MTALLFVVVGALALIAVLAWCGLVCWNCGAIGTVRRGKARFCRACDSFRGFA